MGLALHKCQCFESVKSLIFDIICDKNAIKIPVPVANTQTDKHSENGLKCPLGSHNYQALARLQFVFVLCS